MYGPVANPALEKHYDVLGPIGQGQYGTAYKIKSKADGRVYCLKRIPMGSKDDNTGALKEAQLLAQLNHPNIIAYKESFLDSEGVLCIVTSFCAEGDLAAAIRRRATSKQPFKEEEIMDVFIQVASSLLYIHGHRVLHRDLKTQNIFLDKGGIVMLGDFGISKVLEKTDAFATTVTGTPYYMSPEVCTNQPYTFKSDIWSLGCVLYELCTLRHAFEADSLLSLVYQIVRGSYPPISSERYSASLSDLVNQLLTRDQEARPTLAQVFSLPYVRQHLQRFNSQERSRLLQRTASLKNRTLTMAPPGTAAAAAAAAAGSTVSSGSNEAGADGADGLTPRQRMALKKEQERQRRQLELQVAALNTTQDRHEAARRKAGQLNGTLKLGQPGQAGLNNKGYKQQLQDAAGRGPVAAYHREVAAEPRARSATPSGRQQEPPLQQQWASIWGSAVDPHSISTNTIGAGQALPVASGGRGAPAQRIQTSTNSYDNRAINATGVYDFAAAAAAEAAGGDDGWISSTSTLVGLQECAVGDEPASDWQYMQQHAAQQDWGAVTNTLGDTCGVLMGTMPSQPSGYNFGLQQAPAAAGLSQTGHLFELATPTPPQQQQQQPKSAVGAESPQLNMVMPDKVCFGGQEQSQQQRPCFEYVLGDCKVQPYTARPAAAQEDNDGDEEYYDEDFEDYQDDSAASLAAGAAGDGTAQAAGANPQQQLLMAEVQQRMRILRSVNSISRYYGPEALESSVDDSSQSLTAEAHWAAEAAAAEQEEVRPSSAELQQVRVTAESRLSLLKQRCQAALGRGRFAAVHEYLTDIRAGAAEERVDEAAVRAQLLELVGGDKAALQGCFLVDQLVFEELMHASRRW